MRRLLSPLFCLLSACALAADPPANPRFAEVGKQLDRDGDFYFYLNLRPFNDYIGNLIDQTVQAAKKMAAGQPDGQEALDTINRVYSQVRAAAGRIGINQMGDIGFSATALQGGMFRTRFVLAKNKPSDQGLLWLFSGKNGPGHPGARLMPPDAVLAYGTRPALDEVWTGLKAVVEGTPAAEPFRAWQAQVKEGGFDIDAILKSVGDEFFFSLSLDAKAVMMIPPVGEIPEPGLTLGLKVKDETVPALLQGLAAGLGDALVSSNLNGVAVSVIRPPNAPPQVLPCWTHTQGWLLLAHHPKALAGSLARLGGKGSNLSTNAEYLTYAAGLPENVHAMSFLSRRLGGLYGEIMAKTLANQPGAPPAVPGLLKGLFSSVEKQMGMVSVDESTPDGLRTTMQGPFNYAINMAALMVAIPAVAVAAVLPAVAQARERAESAKCLNNLRMLRHAVLAYQLDNDDKYPADFEALGKYLVPGIPLVCPKGGEYTLPAAEGEAPECSHPGHFLEP